MCQPGSLCGAILELAQEHGISILDACEDMVAEMVSMFPDDHEQQVEHLRRDTGILIDRMTDAREGLDRLLRGTTIS